MSRVEFVADRIRHEWFRSRHLDPPLRWEALQPSERRTWIKLAQAGLDADASYTPRSVNVVRT